MGDLTRRLGEVGALSLDLLSAPVRSRISLSLQVATLIDATGSMRPFIDAAKTHVGNLLLSLAKRYPRVQMATVFYRDHECEHPFSFFGGEDVCSGAFVDSSRVAELQRFLAEEGFCEGNSTAVEALGAALKYVGELPWTARHRVVVHVGDHPSHGYSRSHAPEWEGDFDSIELCPLRMTHERILASLTSANLRCYMVRCGSNEEAERQYRSIAMATNGRFIDFKDIAGADDLMVTIEAAVEDATGGDVRRLIEQKHQAGQIGSPAVRALLESFGDSE